MKSNNTNTFPQRVKERVDFVYQLLTENPSGYRGGFSSQDALTRIVVRCLVRRNVVHKGDKLRNTYTYTWAASMAPTKVLYKNILEDVQKEPSHCRHGAKAAPQQKQHLRFQMERPKPPVVGLRADTGEPMYNVSKREEFLKSLSAQELWDELKSRGAQVFNGEVVILQKLS